MKKSYFSCNFAEIIPYGTYHSPHHDIIRHIIGLLIHTLVAHRNKKIATSCESGLSNNNKRYSLCLERLNFGQELDIKILSAAYDHVCAQESFAHDIVLFGFSRGAATAFNFIATEYKHKKIKRIKAIVLQGCFDSITHCVSSLAASCLEKILPFYKRTGIEPINPLVLNNFVTLCNTYNIPVILISSKKDEVVPYTSSQRLAHALQKAGLQNFTFLTLNNSTHNDYLFDNEDDRALYHYTLHTWYKKNKLSYIPELTNNSEGFLKNLIE